MDDPLLGITEIDESLEAHLAAHAGVFHTFEPREIGQSFGVTSKGWRYFVKFVNTDAVAGLDRAKIIRGRVQHSALPRFLNSITTPDGRADVYEWVDGANLYDDRDRFYALPVNERARALTSIFDLHLMIADAGFIAVDFYDGSLIYDYDRRLLHVCDLDEYRSGPFHVAGERLPGSTRFMAPEEFEPGGRIDQVTNVFTLGRAAFVLLGDGTGNLATYGWNEESKAVAARASSPIRSVRYESVTEFVDAWRQVVEPI